MAPLTMAEKQEHDFKDIVDQIGKNPEDLAKFLHVFTSIRILRHTMERIQTPLEYKDTPFPKFEHLCSPVNTHTSSLANLSYSADMVVVDEVNPATGQSTSTTKYTRSNTAEEVRDGHSHIDQWIARVQKRYAKVVSWTQCLRNEGDSAYVYQTHLSEVLNDSQSCADS